MSALPKVALITGGAVRVGKALALNLAEDGYDIAIHYHNSGADAENTIEAIRKAGRRAVAISGDLADDTQASTIVSKANKALGEISCLINNASVFEKDALDNFTHENFVKHFHVHVEAALVLIRDFRNQLSPGNRGNIINITDGMVGWSVSDKFLTYSLSKMALGNIAPLLARSLAPQIRINTIAPGPTLPGKQDTPNTFSKLEKLLPLGRVSGLEEVCGAVRYLLGAESVTGQTIYLNGGVQGLQSFYPGDPS